MWQRRAFLKAAGAGFVASLLPSRAEALAGAELVFASSIEIAGNRYGAALVTETGTLITQVELPDRGHDVTYSPLTGQAVVFARQPGTFAVVFDPTGALPPRTITSIEGRHFYGHGFFSPDGKLLYATESDFDAARGVIGVYETSGYGRIGEFDTFGTGPHEMLLMPDGVTAVIANGGIETHPDYGRTELNLDSMDPSLAFVDLRDGHLIGQLRLASELHQLSIRHMAVDARQRVWFGCQYRGPVTDAPQLVGYATLDGEIRLLELPPSEVGALRNYVGSVAASADGTTIAVASPEGNTVMAIDAERMTSVATLALDNGCGIAPDSTGFLASSGDGELVGLAGSPAGRQRVDFSFDNHLRALRRA